MYLFPRTCTRPDNFIELLPGLNKEEGREWSLYLNPKARTAKQFINHRESGPKP